MRSLLCLLFAMFQLPSLFLLVASVVAAPSAAASATASGPNDLPLCPSFPDPSAVDLQAVVAHPAVASALGEVDDLLRNASKTIPSGLIATIVLGNITVWTKGYGSRNVSDPAAGPPTGRDLVRIASISKVFTSLLLFLLRDAHRLSLDDDVRKWLPEFSIQRSGWVTEEVVSLRSLASHTSGLPRETPYPCGSFDGPYSPSVCNESTVLALLARQAAVLPPYTRFHYSNLGMAILGRALGHAHDGSGEDPLAYEHAVEEYIFRPLGMANATFAWNATTRARAAVGVDMDGQPVTIGEGVTCGFGAPAGCVWASADDIGRLLQLLFRTAHGGDQRGLSSLQGSTSVGVDGSTVAEFLLPRILLRDGLEAIGTPFEMQFVQPANPAGLSPPAVEASAPEGFWVKGKQGELDGYRSSVTLAQELQLGVFTSALVTDVVDKTVWTIPALAILAPAVRQAMTDLQPGPRLPENASFYVGAYLDGSVTVSIAPSGRELILSGVADSDLFNASNGLRLSATGLRNVLRATPGFPQDCRHLDDGTDLELAYFFDSQGGTLHSEVAAGFEFMGARYNRFHNNTSSGR